MNVKAIQETWTLNYAEPGRPYTVSPDDRLQRWVEHQGLHMMEENGEQRIRMGVSPSLRGKCDAPGEFLGPEIT